MFYFIYPKISFRISHKINNYIVKAKLYPLEGTVGLGSYKCGKKNCEMCDVFLRVTHFLAMLQVRALKLIISLIVMINIFCTKPPVRYVISSTLVKLQTTLDLGGITTNLRVESLRRMKNASKNVFTVIFKVRGITVF